MASSKRSIEDDGKGSDAKKSKPSSSFFTPVSQQSKTKAFRWSNEPWVPKSVFLGTWGYENGELLPFSKIASYDVDGTLIRVKSGANFPKSDTDWEWWDRKGKEIKAKVAAELDDGYGLVLFSNQGGKGKTLDYFKKKMEVVCPQLAPRGIVMAATAKDVYRKPLHGMWKLLEHHLNADAKIDHSKSYYVGDAAGRNSDHNSSDLQFAENAGIAFYTPEEHFLQQRPATTSYLHPFNPATILNAVVIPISPANKAVVPSFKTLEVVLFVGSPASGKTTFFKRYFEPNGYAHVNQDTLKSWQKCVTRVEELLEAGTPLVVDNTNKDVQTRQRYVDVVRKYNRANKGKGKEVKVRVIWFQADVDTCRHNNLYRVMFGPVVAPSSSSTKALRWVPEREILPEIAFISYSSGFEAPDEKEGFEGIWKVNFVFDGTEEERKNWAKRLLEGKSIRR